MGGIDLEITGKRQEFFVNAPVEFSGVLPGAARQIRPADRPDEQRVAREHEPWLRPAFQIGDQQADTLG